MSFPMIPGRFYQLLEVMSPVGYQLPMGQWRIAVNAATPPALPTLTINPVGGIPMPPILPGSTPGTHNIVNWTDFELPLTGGLGIRTFMYTGSGVLLLAVGLYMFARFKRGMLEKVKT